VDEFGIVSPKYRDRFFNEVRAQPMTVEQTNGVLVAKATIGVISQGERGYKTLFR
jgi:hypothetical protein